MILRTASLLMVSAAGAWAAEGPSLANGQTLVHAVGEAGHYTGFDVLAREGGRDTPVARVRWTSAARWTCARCEVTGTALRFSGFATDGTQTPTLAPETTVAVTLTAGDPFPAVSFRLAATAFDAAAWRRAWKDLCPLYFLRLSLPGDADPGQLFYQGGELYPGPEVDPFPITMGPMRGDWSPRWSYAPALGAAPIPAVGLWAPASRLFVAGEFQAARNTDRSDTFIASSYCAGLPDHPGQFVCLSYPHAKGWLNLRLPEGPFDIGTTFRLLYHRDMPSDSDPNRFVINHLLARYREALTPAPRMNDMGWLRQGIEVSQRLFLYDLGLAKDYPQAGVAPILWRPYETCEKTFFDPGAVQLLAHQTGKSARMAWVVKDTAGLAELRRQLDDLMAHAKTERFGDDECIVWEHPVKGQFKQGFGGAPATGTRHMFNWGIASAMLWFYRQEKATEYLPVIDGMVRWTRHCLYDRAGMADLPWAVFSMGAANGGEFLLDYSYTFRDDPERRALAEEAWRLAEVIVYRNTYYYTGDPDAADALDPTFLLQAVNSHYWLGQVTWGEMGRVPEMAIQIYLETGDPFFRYLVRGCLERFYLGTIDVNGHYTENLSIFGETGKKGSSSGGWGANNFRWLAEPLGEALLQVDVGPRGAMAFCRGTKAIDIADYAFAPEASYAFTVTVDARLPGAPNGPFDIMVTSPRRSLAGATVTLNGKALPTERFVIGTAATDAYLRGVRAGDRVVMGAADAKPVPVPLRELPVRGAFSADPSGRHAFVDLTAQATVPVNETWTGDWGGLIPGPMAAAHVHFCLIDPAANAGRGAVALEPAATVPVPAGAGPLVVVLGGPHEVPDDAECARLELSDGVGPAKEVLSLRPDDGIRVQHGMEWYGKDWWLRAFVVGQEGKAIRTVKLTGSAFLFALSVPSGAAVAEGAGLSAEVANARLLALRQRQRQAYQLYQAPTATSPLDVPWLDQPYPYRFLLRLDPIVQPRRAAIIRIKERLDALLRQVGIDEIPDPSMVRAVALDDAGRPAGEVEAQFTPRGTPAGRGELLLRFPGEWTAPRWVAVYLGTTANPGPRALPSASLTVRQDEEVLRCSSSQARLAFGLTGAGPGPRLMELAFGGGPNLLAKAGWDEGFGHLCACQDGVTWYDFGALQDTPAKAEVIDHGPLALTVRVRDLEVFGAGTSVPLDGVGSKGRTAAAVKGHADWFFRLYADDARVDSWVEYAIADPDTRWSRPMEARYALAERTDGQTGDAERTGVAWATQGGLCLVGLDDEGEAPARPYFSGDDGAVLGVHFSKPAFPSVYRSDKWRALPAGLDEGAVLAEAAPVGIEQFAVEARRQGRTERPKPQPLEPERDEEMDFTRVWADPGVPSFRAGQPDVANGLANRDNPDEGASLRETLAGRWCLVPGKTPAGGPQRFVYFALTSTPQVPPEGIRAYVVVEYHDRGTGSALLEYDSVDPTVTKSVVPGAFKEAGERLTLGNTREWRTQVFLCPDARFARHCNGADFRLDLGSGSLAVSRVAVVLAGAGPGR